LKNIENIIKKNNVVDDTLEAMGIKSEYQKTFRNVLYIIVMWIVSMIILYFTNTLWVYHDVGYGGVFYSNIFMCFPIMINSVVDLTFASFIRQVMFLKEITSNNNILTNLTKKLELLIFL